MVTRREVALAGAMDRRDELLEKPILDGRSAMATSSFLAEASRSSRLFTTFSQVSHAPALLLDPLLPGPLQRRGLVHARAARALGHEEWIAGCSRQGFMAPSGKHPSTT